MRPHGRANTRAAACALIAAAAEGARQARGASGGASARQQHAHAQRETGAAKHRERHDRGASRTFVRHGVELVCANQHIEQLVCANYHGVELVCANHYTEQLVCANSLMRTFVCHWRLCEHPAPCAEHLFAIIMVCPFTL